MPNTDEPIPDTIPPRPIAEACAGRGGVVFLVLRPGTLAVRKRDGGNEIELDNEDALELASELIRAVSASERTRREGAEELARLEAENRGGIDLGIRSGS